MNYVSNCAIGGCNSDNSGVIVLIVLAIIVLLVIAYFIYSAISKKKNGK